MTILSIILMAQPASGGASANPIITFLPLIIIILLVVFVVNKSKSSENKPDIAILADQTNKVVNVSLTGGIIGLFSSSPRNVLNSRIQAENTSGWKVIQIIPADSGNIFLTLFRLILLVCTLFLYTTSNGYYVVMERK